MDDLRLGVYDMKIAVLTDIHLYRKTDRVRCALAAAEGADVLLIAGDLADRAQREQYELLSACIREQLGDIHVCCVSGNHDNPARDDTNFREFEREINGQKLYDAEQSGAFYCRLNDLADIIGLNPVYHQKQFSFSEKGRQLAFAEEKLDQSDTVWHILMCHPPLIAHNPQRTMDMSPYIAKEQDARLQRIVDSSRNVMVLSGHTHAAPQVEYDQGQNNIYINCGSICPTETGDKDSPLQQGNITMLEIGEKSVQVCISGIHTGKEFFSRVFPLSGAE